MSTLDAVAEIVKWKLLGETPIDAVPAGRLEAIAAKILETWAEVAAGRLPSDARLEDEEAGPLRGEDLNYVAIIGCVAAFWDVAREAECRGADLTPASPLIGGTFRHIESIFGATDESWLARFTTAYWAFLVTVLGVPMMRRLAGSEPFAAAAFEGYLHRALSSLESLRSATGSESGYEQQLAELGVLTATSATDRLYSRLAAEEQRLWEARAGESAGPYSLMRPAEIALLAARDPAMLSRYGSKRVEQAFEDQLALLVQSLGFAVVRARRGERRVDLLCISGGSPEPTLFLIEAKSSGRPYNFPAKDDRALAEYVREIRRTLDKLPPLGLLLLVGPAAGSGLLTKLRAFEATNAIPTRFVPARVLVKIRQGLPGPVHPAEFRAAMLASPPVADDELAERIVAAHAAVTSAYTNLVRAMLDAGGGKDLIP